MVSSRKYYNSDLRAKYTQTKILKMMSTHTNTNTDHSVYKSLVYFCLLASYFRQLLSNQTANQRIPSAADSLSSFCFPPSPCPFNLTPMSSFPRLLLLFAFSMFYLNFISICIQEEPEVYFTQIYHSCPLSR